MMLRPALVIAITGCLTLSCASTPFPRDTRAANARDFSDDPWIAGDHCAPEIHEETGMRFEEVEPGTGKPVEKGATVRVHYAARLADGSTLHDTRGGGPPIEIIIGSTRTICGFERALVGMRPGGQRRAFIPANLAFGDNGKGSEVQPKTDLVFTIDLFLPADVVQSHGSPPVNPVRPGPGGGGRTR